MRTMLVLITLLCAVVGASTAYAELLAGAAKRSLVPPFPTFMGGFGDRLKPFEGVHDDLHASALALDNGDVRLIIIGSGLMSMEEELVRLVRESVYDRTGIPKENVLVSCVHNHSAPSYYQYPSEDERKKPREFFAKQFADAAVEAFETRVPAELGSAVGELKGATRNRQQDNEVVIDTTVGVIRVEKLEGREIIAVLFNVTGHPVILGPDNLLLSGEYPGVACRTIEAVLGGVAIATQGACGDVTVHRSGDPWLEIERVGRLVAGEVIKTAEAIKPAADVRLASVFETVRLNPKPLPAIEDARAELEQLRTSSERAKAEGRARDAVRYYERRIDLLSALLRQAEGTANGALARPEFYEGSVHVVQVGDMVLIGVPGELFVEYVLEMRQRVAQTTGKSLMLVGYANGHVGYIVTPRAMHTGGYEASVARVDDRAGRVLTERAMAIVLEAVR